MADPLSDFDFRALDDIEFREDAVREEIIAPVIRALGFAAAGPCRVVRGRRLTHPYVSIGSTRKKLSLVPDYLLLVDDRVLCVLEAKAPAESVSDPDHLSQAYSYAVHREVQAPAYALCNGRELVMHRVSEAGRPPALLVPVDRLREHWPTVTDRLGPFALGKLDPQSLPRDYGLHLRAAGLPPGFLLIAPDVRFESIAHVGQDTYSIMSTITEDDQDFAASFDFPGRLLHRVVERAPSRLRSQIIEQLRPAPRILRIPETRVSLSAVLTESVFDNNGLEFYSPFLVQSFSRPPD